MKRISRVRKWLLAGLLPVVVLGVSGCRTLSFYAQAIRGQYQIVASQRAVEKLLKDPATPEPLRARLRLVQEIRQFALHELKLPIDGHYNRYADLHRPFVVWNVEAAPEFSMEPKTWWYPVVGSLEYRGYFTKPGATNYAAYLRRKGYDVSVGGVQAYSTLGWFKDPVLNTFVFEPDAELAEILFHELAHQRVFARGDTDFNEAFATTVGQEGTRRWLQAKRSPDELEAYLAQLRRNEAFVQLVMATRAKLEALYGDERTADGKVKANGQNHRAPPPELRRQKQAVFDEFKRQYADLKREWGGNTEYDGWFAESINNSHLNSVATYYDLVPGFEHLLALNGGDLERFYDAAKRLAGQPKAEREQSLRAMAQTEKLKAKAAARPG